MRSLNKRGFWMGEEAGKFILGVIAIVLLFLLAFKLAGIMRQNTSYEQAKYTLGQIEESIKDIKEGETKNVFVESPKNWLMQIKTLPNNKKELCICPQPDYRFWNLKNIRTLTNEVCESKGICKMIKKKVAIPMTCYATIPECTIFSKVPLLITLRKSNEIIGLYNNQISPSIDILSKIISNETNMKILENYLDKWSPTFAIDVDNILKKTIKDYEEENSLEVEEWYFIIGKEKWAERKYYSWGKEINPEQWICLNDIEPKVLMGIPKKIVDFYVKDNNKRLDSIGKNCIGGDWASIIIELKNEWVLLELHTKIKT